MKKRYSNPVDQVTSDKYEAFGVRRVTETAGFHGVDDLDEVDDCPVPAFKAPKSKNAPMFAFADSDQDEEEDKGEDPSNAQFLEDHPPKFGKKQGLNLSGKFGLEDQEDEEAFHMKSPHGMLLTQKVEMTKKFGRNNNKDLPTKPNFKKPISLDIEEDEFKPKQRPKVTF